MTNTPNSRKLMIARAASRLAKKWKNTEMTWDELVQRCASTVRTNESLAEYLRLDREQQSSIKDVGGFVGGYLRDGLRKSGTVGYRSVATLDIDHGAADCWERLCGAYSFAALMYSTHKHTPESPRLRLVFPLSRDVSPEEYEPLCRRVAEAVGIDAFDPTTYQCARLMYWPSTPADGEFYFRKQDGPFCDVDAVLGTYANFRDASTWPTADSEAPRMLHAIKKAGDPRTKQGLVGAFCRTYDIHEAIAKFLPKVYEEAGSERYTYTPGHVSGGLVVYDEARFAYANNETDPCSGQLCNAFDLVRIHLYGELDEKSRTEDITKRPSYKAMLDHCLHDSETLQTIDGERYADAMRDFAALGWQSEEALPVMTAKVDGVIDKYQEICTALRNSLDRGRKNGDIESSSKNLTKVLEGDPWLKGKLWYDEFRHKACVTGGLCWNPQATQWSNEDEANLRNYLDRMYSITGKDKIRDAVVAELTKHKRHPIREYLTGLQWDGKPRLDRLIIDYIGAEDTPLTRAMTRKHFTAAVARVFRPGCKYDYCLILSGAEGIGKSTLFSVMGGEWFSDSVTTLEGKEGMEQIHSGWILELSELSGMRRSEVEQVKAAISRQEDRYRPPYGAVMEDWPREQVFCGTTNEEYFLKGETGNRRFWVIQVDARRRRVTDTRQAVEADRDQLWAEAVHCFKAGEQLYLDREMEAEARLRQKRHNDDADDPVRGLLDDFLTRPLPADWHTYDLFRRRDYYRCTDLLTSVECQPRTSFCIAEFICECMGRDLTDREYRYLARRIGAWMKDVKGWELKGGSRSVAEGRYGKQKVYCKNNADEEDEENL